MNAMICEGPVEPCCDSKAAGQIGSVAICCAGVRLAECSLWQMHDAGFARKILDRFGTEATCCAGIRLVV
jgi:hypothetical protein